MIKAAVLAEGGNNARLTRLVQLLNDHPEVEVISYADSLNEGRRLSELYPALTGETDLTVTGNIDINKTDIVFLACDPDTASRFMRAGEIPESLYVIDMTGLYTRTDDPRFVQGIPELNRKAMVRGARYIAMPEAATTAVALALLPLAKNLLLKANVHANIVYNNPDAEPDSLTNNMLDDLTKSKLDQAVKTLQPGFAHTFKGVVFTGDIPEGLMAVTTVNTDLTLDELKRIYNEFYDDHNFTFIVNTVPDISDVRDTNKSFIHLDKADGKAVITSVLDTDMKGGAGNAVHVMNLLFGLIEKVGL